MSKAWFEDILIDLEQSEEMAFPASDKDLLDLTEKLLEFDIPTKVFFQALDIATYDCASAIRYFEHYLTTIKKKHKFRTLVFSRTASSCANNN
ncbi:MAG: hypothetical protein KME23_01240 [Goleter apudmare HA4340-LM2]|jgi:hypothetical protein|nr:hypothetical protein [Goleter apudmare HA4340-LM2]